MRSIFISYRRGDAEGQAGRLFDDLAAQFGKTAVFMDVEDIEPGRDFRKVIDQHVSSCGVLLALVGKGWLTATDHEGRRRLDDPNDFVRLETASALKRDIPVIPVLVQGAAMPKADSLPDDLKEFAFRNAVELTHARWESDVQLLIKALGRYVEAGEHTEQPEAATVVNDATAKSSSMEALGPIKRAEAPNAGPSAKPPQARMAWLSIMIAVIVTIAFATGGYKMYDNTKKAAEKQKVAEAKAEAERVAAAEKQRIADEKLAVAVKMAEEQRIAKVRIEAEQAAVENALKKKRDEERMRIEEERKKIETEKKRLEEERKRNELIAIGNAKNASADSVAGSPPKKKKAKKRINTSTTQNQSLSSSDALPAGIISDNQDSVQILKISPVPGSYLHRGQPQIFMIKMAYFLSSADVAILSMSVAQIRENQDGCAGKRGQLTDAKEVQIYRGKHIVDVALKWSGDSVEATKGHVDMKGYLRFVPMFWRINNGRRGDRIQVFEGYENVCMSFGP